MNKISKTILAITLGGLTACTNIGDNSPTSYSRSELQRAQYTSFGTILEVNAISIQGDDSPLLTIAGTALGALAGAQVGGGTGRIAGAVVGGLASGYGVNAASKALTKTNGVELTVKMDNGETLTFAQEGDIKRFAKGMRVKVAQESGKYRVL